jgi:hypothetical protein
MQGTKSASSNDGGFMERATGWMYGGKMAVDATLPTATAKAPGRSSPLYGMTWIVVVQYHRALCWANCMAMQS